MIDVDGVLTAYADSVPRDREADALLEALFGDAAEAPGETAWYWILHGAADSTWSLASRVHRPCGGSREDGRLHDADRLTILVLMPQSPWTGEVPATARAARWARGGDGAAGEARAGVEGAPAPAREAVVARDLRRPCSGRDGGSAGPPPGVVDARAGSRRSGGEGAGATEGSLLHAIRAGTLVREEAAAGRGGPGFLALLLGGLGSLLGPDEGRTPGPRVAVGIPTFDVAVHTTTVSFDEATIRASVEVRRDSLRTATPAGAATLGDLLRDRVDRARTQLLLGYVGYTPQVGAVFDALRQVFESPSCPAPAAGVACSHALQDALVGTVAAMDLTAEHRARAVQRGAADALLLFEGLLAAPARGREATFRVVERSRLGFSVGGLLEEDEADRLRFTVEDGQVVADGLEGEGFRSLALVDVYPWPVDLSDPTPGFHPHLSIGFSVGHQFRPAAFGALPLCLPGVLCVLGRAALIGGVVLRNETEPGDGGDRDAVDETLRARPAWGVKVALPLSP
ncbi:MAG TPA: hypothetical protein VIC56_00130 [Gemmatimonadota bacterium]